MQKLKIKKGDTVKVIAGDHRNSEGKVISVNREKNTAIVEGVNLVSKASRPNAKNPQGGIMKKEAPVHVSNLMLVDGSGKTTRVGRKLDDKGNIVRYSKKSGEVIK
jgi:large subunit ribosomal protein L24